MEIPSVRQALPCGRTAASPTVAEPGRNNSSVTNLNTLAHISLLAVAVAAVATNNGQSYRKLKSAKRTA